MRSFTIEPADVPAVIDEIPALAALAAMMPEGQTLTVRGAAELRVKESDRITALAAGFRAMGAGVDEYPDGFTLRGAAAHRRGRSMPRRPPPGDGLRDRRDARRGPDDHHSAPPRSMCPIPASSTSSTGSPAVTADKIYLVGFMAAGKTTVARALAARLGWRAEDIDELIEARERRTVAEIFARSGEPYFRALERDILQLLLPLRHVVVATGGGTFVDPDNRAAMNLDGVSVWLDVPFEEVLARLPADGRRPLAADRAQMERLFAVRRSRPTRRPTFSVDARGARAEEVAERIVEASWDGASPLYRAAMRYLILSDIHANLDALDAVLAAADGTWDRLLVLGDLVGYGGEPNGVIDRLRGLDPLRSSAATTTRRPAASTTAATSTSRGADRGATGPARP